MKTYTSPNDLSIGLLDRPWSPNESVVAKSYSGRVIKSVILLEEKGYDWIGAVRSIRFFDGRETVARILAYPAEPGKSSEVLKLLRLLGIDDSDQGKYALDCGVHFTGIPAEKLEHQIWQRAAEIAEFAYHPA